MTIKKFFRKATFRFLKLLCLPISAILGIFCNFGGTMYGPAPKSNLLTSHLERLLTEEEPVAAR